MDADDDRFIGNFVDELSQMIGTDLLDVDDRSQTIRAINAELDTQFEFDGWQYYYVFENPLNESQRRRRHELAKKLDDLFPRIAIIALDRDEPSPDEFDTLSRLRRILCRAAGIEIKPHET